MKISIIIPTLNEYLHIGNLVSYLKKYGSAHLAEILVCDGGSEDDTCIMAKASGAKVILSPVRSRAAQMNLGASLATGDIFYFVHADTLPPATFARDIINCIVQGYHLGRYLSAYQSNSWLLKVNAFLSRFDTFPGMGGDQTLFVTKDLFRRAGGFDQSKQIMEEFDFCARARKEALYKVIPKAVLISARKYEKNSWLKVQKANITIVSMYKFGASQESMLTKYRELLQR